MWVTTVRDAEVTTVDAEATMVRATTVRDAEATTVRDATVQEDTATPYQYDIVQFLKTPPVRIPVKDGRI